MAKLTIAQAHLLGELPCTASQSYGPARKLVALGYAKWVHLSYGGTRLEITDEGQAVRAVAS